MEESRGEVRVGVVEAPGALRGLIMSEGEIGADCGIAYDGTEFGSGVMTAAGDERAEIVDGWLGWRIGLGAGVGVVGKEVGKWRGWADVPGQAER